MTSTDQPSDREGALRKKIADMLRDDYEIVSYHAVDAAGYILEMVKEQEGARGGRDGECLWVKQEHPRGCGVACLAMVTRLPYAEVAAWCAKRDLFAEGIYTRDRDMFLFQRGYSVCSRFRYEGAPVQAEVRPWPPLPFAPVHLCEVRVVEAVGHHVVMLTNGDVLDPLTPEPRRLSDYLKVDSVTGVWKPDQKQEGRGRAPILSGFDSAAGRDTGNGRASTAGEVSTGPNPDLSTDERRKRDRELYEKATAHCVEAVEFWRNRALELEKQRPGAGGDVVELREAARDALTYLRQTISIGDDSRPLTRAGDRLEAAIEAIEDSKGGGGGGGGPCKDEEHA